jgi:hypothetical protein
MNDVEIIEKDVTAISDRQSGGLLDANPDNILYMAEQAEKYITAMNKIMAAALKITTELDWVLIGGQPYLQESGATKVARLFGISWQSNGNPEVIADAQGYKTFTHKMRFFLGGQFIDAEGSRSMRDEFFSGRGCTKKPDEIDERDVRLSAYTNCINNGIKRLIPGLRGIDVKTLEASGFDVAQIRGYTFKDGSKGGASNKADDSGLVCSKCNKPVTQSVASFSQGKYGAVLCMDCQKEANK